MNYNVLKDFDMLPGFTIEIRSVVSADMPVYCVFDSRTISQLYFRRKETTLEMLSRMCLVWHTINRLQYEHYFN
jgi:hypothetical protein